jgi:hypothetical protein
VNASSLQSGELRGIPPNLKVLGNINPAVDSTQCQDIDIAGIIREVVRLDFHVQAEPAHRAGDFLSTARSIDEENETATRRLDRSRP